MVGTGSRRVMGFRVPSVIPTREAVSHLVRVCALDLCLSDGKSLRWLFLSIGLRAWISEKVALQGSARSCWALRDSVFFRVQRVSQEACPG